ncbi:hypothetical protein NIES4075_12370 [Tolypothrix sp. NIES-4075]|uniref:hypothetical protein n=1 Tax=Tolypothrix sp. NIES-4075 TaxID=2005459 RepID=UPI000B5CAD9F|nr:hypothetical protein [Tolypothrix sp. NIES-4075]GAX40273.1 hypothetical protein NIES4075_12370 [Tolypothrix sp. NIES-4075]
MRHHHVQQEAIQLDLLKRTLQGWEPALPVIESDEWSTEQLERRFSISRQDLYKNKSQPYYWHSSIFVFFHMRRNKWRVYKLNPLRLGE